MTLKVRVLRRASADADHIFEWLGRRSPLGAATWYAAFLDSLQRLPLAAEGCSRAPEADRLQIDLRQALFKTRRGRTYRLVFVIEGDEVRVLRVRGPGQSFITRRDLPPEKS